MSGQTLPILNLNQLPDQVAKAVATLGTRKATDTARVAAARTLHEALIMADSRASSDELITATSEVAAAMRVSDPSINPGHAANGMRSHLAKIGDLKLKPKKLPTSPLPDPGPDTVPIQASKPQETNREWSIFGWKPRFLKKGVEQDR